MKPAFNVATRDPVRDIQSLQAGLNRDSFRTAHIVVPVDAYRDGHMDSTVYTDVHWPFEDGEVLRMARFLVPEDYRIPRSGPRVAVAIGIRGVTPTGEATFRLLGTEWDSRLHTFKVGAPFVLTNTETKIPVGKGLALRIMRLDFPTTPLRGASVEVSIGYEGVS